MLAYFRKLSLVTRFAMTGVAVIVLAMGGIGLWVARTRSFKCAIVQRRLCWLPG